MESSGKNGDSPARMFDGKKLLILGVANEKSIAWGIAERLRRSGAELAFTYPNEALKKRVAPLAASLDSRLVLPCDVQSDAELDSLFGELAASWGELDGVVHAVAYARKEELSNPFSQTTRDGFALALDISVYSLIAVARRAAPLMKRGGSIVTLSYLGAQRVVPNYNVMGVAKAALEASVRYLAADLGACGIRVNAVSAGPLKTLAASGIPGFRELLGRFEAAAPLRRGVTQEDVAGAALYLLGPLGSGVTGETTYVDCGFNTLGVY